MSTEPIYNELGERICEFPECGRRYSSSGLCTGHYNQRTAGKPLLPLRARTPKYTGCRETDCLKLHYSGGLCRAHYDLDRYPEYVYVAPPADYPHEIRPVVDFPHYWVSETGHVWTERHGGAWMSPCIRGTDRNPLGYRYVNLHLEAKGYSRKIARLVLEAFVGPRPEGYVICHGSGGQHDDSLENLEWGTLSKNNGADKLRDGTLSWGESHYNATLTEEDVKAIREEYATGTVLMRTLALRYGVGKSAISRIISRQSWAHVA